MTKTPHIVSVVGNDITFDTRIKKVAAAAAAAGFRSTILCYTASGVQRTNRMGDVDVIRVPVPFHAHGKNGRVGTPLRPFNGAELAARHAGPRTHLQARRRWLQGRLLDQKTSPLSKKLTSAHLAWVRASLVARHTVFRLRRRGHVELDKIIRLVNRARVRATLRIFRSFRDAVPNIADYEVTFGPILESLEPDLIHAHDYHMIGIAVTAARHLEQKGLSAKVLYDAHELIEGLSYPKPTIDGWLELEREYIHAVDAVTGVSPEQIDRIQERYGLDEKPSLVMNAPVIDHAAIVKSDIRSDSGISGRIIAYHGNIFLERGLNTVIEALQSLEEDVHLVVLAPKNNPLIHDVRNLAGDMGVTDRLHILGYVPAEQLPGYVSTADLAVIPYLMTGNNDIALPNKFFESIQARLPLLVSNMRSMGRIVNEYGIGEVFEAGDAGDLARGASKILSQPQAYRDRMTPEVRAEFSWDTQARRLTSVYQRVLDTTSEATISISVADITEELTGEGDIYRPTRLAVGPRNMAGQAYAIGAAVQSSFGIPTVSFSVEKPLYRFPVHIQISEQQWHDPSWQLNQRRLLAAGFTHVLAESGTGMLGSMNGGFIDQQLDTLREDGLRVAVLLHGSEIRDPRRHRQLPHSPYAIDDEVIRSLEQATARLRSHFEGLDIPLFVTTPDLLEDVPATWLPVALDTQQWAGLKAPFQNPVPTVLHLPSNSILKGSSHIDPVLRTLDSEGLVSYLRPDVGTTADNVPDLVEMADIVVDQLVVGAYGLMSCQAMAAGRLAIANIRDIGFLKQGCPVIDADPDSLDRVMRDLLADRQSWDSRAAAGRDFVETNHNGKASAIALQQFLGTD